MPNDSSKYEEAAFIRGRFNDAIQQAYAVYCESEEIAAYATLELFRLENARPLSKEESQDDLDRFQEKSEALDQTKKNMFFILEKIHELARDRDKYVSDIYMSTKILDIEHKLEDLTPWIEELRSETKSQAESAKMDAKITAEIAEVHKVGT